VTLTATLRNANTSAAISGKTINFTLNGTSVGSPATNGSGVATLSGVSLSGIAVGTYPGAVAATFPTGDATFNASTGSNTLTVNSAAPTKLVITGAGTQTAGTGQNLTITAKDASNNTVTTYTGDKSLTFSGAASSTNPVTAPTVKDKTGAAIAYGSATTIAFTSGVATVSAGNNSMMTLYKAETVDIAVPAGDGAAAAADSLHVVVSAAAANKLAFGVQPTNTAAGSAISPAVTVQIQDQFGNVVTTDSSNVTISISNPGVLSGSSTLIVAASSGVATFSNIIPTKTGTGFTLHAIDASLTAADSSSFNVTAGAAASLTVSGYPSPTAAGDSHTFTVTAKDAFDNTATGYLGTVHFTSSDGAAVLPANYTFLSGDNGTHTFSATLKTSG